MKAILEKAHQFILGLNEEEEEEYLDTVEEDDDTEEIDTKSTKEKRSFQTYRNSSREPRTTDNVSRIYPESQFEIVMCYPKTVEDTPIVVNHLRANHVCVINLEGVETDKAQRIADFLGGASHAMSGIIERVNNNIFIMAPLGISISGSITDDIKSGGAIFPWLSSLGSLF